MSPTATLAMQTPVNEISESTEISFQIKKDDSSLLWQQVNDILRNSIERTALQKAVERRTQTSKPHVLVAPGVLVPEDEYKKRFSKLNLEQYRKNMTPELFLAFVRHIGFIPGNSKISIEKLLSNPED